MRLAVALGFAGMITNPSADAGQGIFLKIDPQPFVDVAVGDGVKSCGDVNSDRTGLPAGSDLVDKKGFLRPLVSGFENE